MKNIEDIEIGDYVLTHKGRYRKVWRTIKKPFKGKAYEIKPYGSLPFIVTYNHPILTSKRNSHTYKMSKTEWSLPTELTKKRLLFPINKDILANLDIPNKKDYLRMIGLYLAEGSCRTHSSNKGKITFGLHTKEHHTINFLKTFFKKMFDIEVKEYINGNSTVLQLNSVQLVEDIFQYFGKRENKKLPHQYLHISPEDQLEILKGWMEGDGYVDSRGWNIGATISYELAIQMFNILLRNNINPNIRKLKRNRYGKNTKDQYWIEFKKNAGNNRKTKIENNHRYSSIQYVKELDLNEEVYNIEVEEDESYVVEQTIVHNCVDALSLANKATQIGGIPFAVTNFDGGNAVPGGAELAQTFEKDETELVKLIKMGMIK
jgi:hypothetical protein